MARIGRRQGQSRLRPPTITGAAVTFRPLQVRLADPQRPRQVATRRAPHSRLRPPTVASPAVVFRRESVWLANVQPNSRVARKPHPKLSPPSVVNPPVVFRPIALKRVTQPRRYQHALSRLQPPTVIGTSAAVSTQELGLLTMGVGT